MGLFTDIFSDKPAEEAAKAKALGFQNANTSATGALNTGQASADALYGQAFTPFSALYDKGSNDYSKYSGAYADATGVNGAEGIARGGSTFKALPGYSGGLTTGIDAVNRGAAARGLLGSGQTSADEIKFASDYDANHYKDYLSSLVPGLSTSGNLMTTGATGGAGVLGARAGADLGVAGQKAQYGYNAATGTGNANADAALAPYSSSKNFWSALAGAASIAAAPFTGGASLAGLGALGGIGKSTNTGTGDGSWYGQSSVGGAPLS